MQNTKGKKVKCIHCGHAWLTRSVLLFLTCPNCQRKTPTMQDGTKQVKLSEKKA